MKLAKRYSLALEALEDAGERIRKDFYVIKDKNSLLHRHGDNFSTNTDIISEKIIIDKITKSFSTDTIISEESEGIETKSDYVWTIDPLDGTSNFFMNIPYFGVCLSIQFQGKTQFAAIYNPLSKDVAFAVKNEGVFLNEQPVSISHQEKSREPLTGFYIQGYGIEKRIEAEIYSILLLHSKRVLNTWAPSLDWLNLLQGNADFIVNYHTESEDFVPGAFIYEEAGGRVETWSQEPVYLDLRKDRRVSAIAGHPLHIERIRSIISKINIPTTRNSK